MRKIEILFLFCVLGCGGLFAARSITQSVPLLRGGTPPGSPLLGVAGQSRDVDMAKLKRLLQQRTLSDHEAEFYEPLGTPSRLGDKEDERTLDPRRPIGRQHTIDGSESTTASGPPH